MSDSPLSKQPKKTAKPSVKPKKVSSKKNILITLEAYLASKPDSKRLKKRFARAVKFYQHSCETLTHANADFQYTKEACLCLLQAAEHIIQESQHFLDTWQNPTPKDAKQKLSQQNDFSAELHTHEQINELEMHLRQISKDMDCVLHNADSAVEDLHRAEMCLLEMIAMAKEDKHIIYLDEAKAFVIQKAKGSPTPKKAKKSE